MVDETKPRVGLLITNGNGSELAIDENNNLLAYFDLGQGKDSRVNLGPCTLKTIQILQDNLERLKVHALD